MNLNISFVNAWNVREKHLRDTDRIEQTANPKRDSQTKLPFER